MSRPPDERTTVVRPEGPGEAAGPFGALTVVIVNWETPDYTIRSVESLAADGVARERVVVVDNGSRDGSFERFRDELAGCVLVRLDENVGFGNASNVGTQALPGDAYIFVNSDAFVHRPGSVQRLSGALTDPAVGLVVPRIVNEDLSLQPSVVPVHSPAVALVRASGLSRFVPNRWQPGWSTHWDHATSREIEAANGAVVLARGETWQALGGFDPRIYMYAEDLDLCWRARKLGWKVWFVHDAEFLHLGGSATGKRWGNEQRAEVIGRSEAVMIRRNMRPLASGLTLAFTCAGIAARAALFAAVRNREAASTHRGALRGYLAGARAPRPS